MARGLEMEFGFHLRMPRRANAMHEHRKTVARFPGWRQTSRNSEIRLNGSMSAMGCYRLLPLALRLADHLPNAFRYSDTGTIHRNSPSGTFDFRVERF